MKPGRPPSLLLSGLLTLLPVLALALVGLRSLQTDQADIENAARRELASLSARLASEIATRWQHLAPTPEETLALDPDPRTWPEAEPPPTTWRLDAAGEPVDVFFAPEIPVPPPWWLAWPESQRAAYRTFVAAEGTNGAVTPPDDWPLAARLAAEFERRRSGLNSSPNLNPATGPPSAPAWGIVLPSGLSRDEAALWRELQPEVTATTLPGQLGRLREHLEREQPGTWPELDARLAAWEPLAHGTDRTAVAMKNGLGQRRTISAVRQFGSFRAREREKLREYQRQYPVAGWRPGGHQWGWDTHSFCSVLQALPADSTNATAAPRSARWLLTHVADKPLYDIALTALQTLAPETPPYARPRIRWADRDWNMDGPWPSIATNFNFGPLRPIPWGNLIDENAIAEAGFEIADPRQLFAGHRRRAATLGALIVGAALISSLGFWQLRRAFQQQAHLAEQQANFVASVSHELRAPVASVGLLVESLRHGDVTEPARRDDYLRLIGRECRRLAQLIQNVLATGRLDQGRREYVKEPFDLRRLVEETVAGFLPLAREQSVALETAVAEPPPGLTYETTGDSLAWQQAVTNLLDNALKHSPPAATVRVELSLVAPFTRTTTSQPTLRLTIDDAGPGVPEAERERIFERFYRRGSELRRETEGIGLGLTLVRHTVEAHGGRVWCEANPSGQGSRFIIEIPIHP